ncbi:MAG: hypothetical protein WC269_02860 [Candidatus Gracilibacteria bacterium]|jgi:hypothetical protein
MMKKLKLLGLAFLFALAWLLVGGDQYGYNHNFGEILGLNLFPLICWGFGLFAMFLIYEFAEKYIKPKRLAVKLALFAGIYWPLLVVAETVGYYTFNIQNVATAMYEGLPICDCMHAPWWMQIAYFLIGPFYFVFARFFVIGKIPFDD